MPSEKAISLRLKVFQILFVLTAYIIGISGCQLLSVVLMSGGTILVLLCHDILDGDKRLFSEPCARPLPSKRLLGKGLASVGYETELKGERFARLDFIGVPSSTFRKEASVVAGLEHHQNVVRAHDWVVDKASCSLVLEYMEDDLLGLIQKRKESSQPFELAEALYIILQIARGMKHLHEQKILHGDLKTNNILVKKKERDALFLAKVADYGLVRTKRKSMSFVSRQARKLDVVRWKAPETLEKVLSQYKDETSSESDSNSDDESVGALDSVLLRGDVYSFAVTCSQILTGEDPYPNLEWKELGVRIVSGTLRPELPAASPLSLKSLLVSCWSKAPAQRPAFSYICKRLEQILQHLQTMKTPDNAMTPATNFSWSLLRGSKLTLVVEILEASNLAADSTGFSNPYVEVQLGRQKPQRTQVIKKTNDPKWKDEQLHFSIDSWFSPNLLTLRVRNSHRVRYRPPFEFGILVVPLNEMYQDPRKRFDDDGKPYEFWKRYEFCEQLDKVKQGQLRFAITVYGHSHPPGAPFDEPRTSDTVMCQTETQEIKSAVDVVASDWVEAGSMQRSKSYTDLNRMARTPPKPPPKGNSKVLPGAGQGPPPLGAIVQEAKPSLSSFWLRYLPRRRKKKPKGSVSEYGTMSEQWGSVDYSGELRRTSPANLSAAVPYHGTIRMDLIDDTVRPEC